MSMDRIAVVGSGGAGKTTLCRLLGERLDLPVIHLDAHYWRPGWTPTNAEEWRRRQQELLAGERWIVDGNYSSTLDLRLSRADTVIVLALSRWRCLLGVARRWLRYHGHELQASGCPERVDLSFLRWVWDYPTSGRARLDAAVTAHAGEQIRIVELVTRGQIESFLAAVER